MANFKELSKQNWGNDISGTIEQLGFGCLQRIADATEAMAQNYVKLQKDYDYMRGDRDYYRDSNQRALNSIRSLKGTITKLKKKIKQ